MSHRPREGEAQVASGPSEPDFSGRDLAVATLRMAS
jgi:hypothetical protein